MNKDLFRDTISRFRTHFGKDPEYVAYAPGRVEVIGNHTDYNDGFVLSAAINYGTFFAIAKNDSSECRLVAGDLMREVRFPVDNPQPVVEDSWANYCMGVHAGFVERGVKGNGFCGLLLGNIPQGAGLSSSAALEVTTGLAIAKLYGIEVSKLDFAKIGQKAEHTFAGVKCGLLDQISSIFGAKNMLVKTDFRTLEVTNVPLPAGYVLLVCNSNAKHALVDGAYNQRRADCEVAAAYFKEKLDHPVAALRDVTWAEWEKYREGMEERVAKRSAHPIGEDERVLKGSELLDKGDVLGFGQLMYASHDSSIRYFANSCEELDILVEICKSVEGVLGARLSGGGFGGSVVALVRGERAADAAVDIAETYKQKTGKQCDVLSVTPSEGAHIVEEQ